MAEAGDFFTAITTSVVSSVTVSGFAVYVFRTWITERLRESIRHEYAEQLSKLNAALRAEGDARQAALIAKINREADKLRLSATSFSEVQKAAIGRKLDSVETLWRGVLTIRAMVPAGMTYADVLTEEEYVNSSKDPKFRELMGQFDEKAVARSIADNAGSLERVRPYLSKITWLLFESYQASMIRAVVITYGALAGAKPTCPWYKDEVTRRYIRAALGDEDFKMFEEMPISKYAYVRQRFERKILDALDRVVTGQEYGEAALTQLQRTEAELERVELVAEQEKAANCEAAQR